MQAGGPQGTDAPKFALAAIRDGPLPDTTRRLMRINDVLSGVLIGAFGVSVYLHAQSFPPMPGQAVGPNMFPQLIAAGLMVCAALLVARGLKTLKTESWISLPGWAGQGRTVLGFVLIPLVLTFYVAVSERLGFLPTAVALLTALFLVFGVKLKTAIPVALLGSLGIHTLFYKLLKVPLPWGILESLAW